MKKAISLLVTLLLILSFSCKEKKKETTQMDSVMAIHDEVMPKMGTINTLAKKLSIKINANTVPTKYVNAKEDLEKAHASMMDWMTGFSARFSSDEILDNKALTPEKKDWLNEEETKVKELRDQINSSIKNAEKLLGN